MGLLLKCLDFIFLKVGENCTHAWWKSYRSTPANQNQFTTHQPRPPVPPSLFKRTWFITLPETNIAHKNPPVWWYLPGKMGSPRQATRYSSASLAGAVNHRPLQPRFLVIWARSLSAAESQWFHPHERSRPMSLYNMFWFQWLTPIQPREITCMMKDFLRFDLLWG